MSIMRAQLPRELHAYGDMVGNRAALDTGAPSITYQGQEGPQAGGQPSPEELIIQLQEAYKQHRAQGGQLTFEEFVEVVMSQNQNRQQAASGGIMGVPRQGFLLGKLVKGVKKIGKKIKDDIIPNELKNPAGLIAAATAANYLPKMMGGEQTLLQRFLPKGITQTISDLNPFNKNPSAMETGHPTMTGDAGRGGNDKWWMEGIKDISETGDYVGTPPYVGGSTQNTDSKNKWYSGLGQTIGSALLKPEFLIPAAGLVSGAFAKQDDPGYTGQGTGLNIRDIGKLANISDEKVGQAAGLRFLPEVSARKYTPAEMIETYAATEPANFETPAEAAQGGRIGFNSGGFTPEELVLLKQHKYNPSEVAKWKDKGKGLLSVLRNPNAEGGRIGGITPDQDAMIRDMLNKGMDSDTISTIGDVTPEQIEMIIRQINEAQRGLEESGTLEEIINLNKAKGGRIGAQDGGLMSLGGMEMDLRGGGFVPIGEREKADDVPARLSKNEFVFTADAVRAAGDGDVNKGADKMYRTMKDLEGMVA